MSMPTGSPSRFHVWTGSPSTGHLIEGRFKNLLGKNYLHCDSLHADNCFLCVFEEKMSAKKAFI